MMLLVLGLAVCFATAMFVMLEATREEATPPGLDEAQEDEEPLLDGDELAMIELDDEPGADGARIPADILAAARGRSDVEIVELPVGPVLMRIGAPVKRPDPDRLIQTVVLEQDGRGPRTLAWMRLIAVVGAVGLAFGLGLTYGPRVVVWVLETIG